MTSHVFRLHSTLELPLDDVHSFFESPALPEGIADIEITRRNNTLIVSAVASDTSLSKYTPTAQLKASVTENRVYENEDGEWVDEPPQPQRVGNGSGDSEGPQWGSFGEVEEEPEIPSKLVEYACFKGDRETVLQNSALQHEMFLVLRELALTAEKGSLTAITAEDGDLVATRIVDGEERAASVDVIEDPRENESENGVNWRDNEFIS
ncbi:MAG: hypothetical protein ABEJ06_06110 [Haloarculaceae archaeon]